MVSEFHVTQMKFRDLSKCFITALINNKVNQFYVSKKLFSRNY